MPEFNKYVQNVNQRDLRFAIEQGMKPMQTFFNPKHNGLPYFANRMANDEQFGNWNKYATMELSHMPGRWLDALLSAEAATGIHPEPSVIERLRHIAYSAMDTFDIGMPLGMDDETLEINKEIHLHNMREQMHALHALYRYRGDKNALVMAEKLIDTVNKYFDFEKCELRYREFHKDTGGNFSQYAIEKPQEMFAYTFGRLIGPVVKIYQASGSEKALDLAIKLKNTCFQYVLNEKGDYDSKIFGIHSHSVTSMLSSLALLGEALADMEILERVKNFMENGLNHIALDFGWSIENFGRDDILGEINNSGDLVEACLVLGKAGFTEYFARAERILRGHILPAQLLDTHFIENRTDPEDDATYRLAERSIGAFGAPSPYGHETSVGESIGFNWDITAGGVSSLSFAYARRVTKCQAMLSIDLLFDYEDSNVVVKNPYDNHDTVRIDIKNSVSLRVRIPSNSDTTSLTVSGADSGFAISGNYIYLYGLQGGQTIEIHFNMKNTEVVYPFRSKRFKFRWHGEEVIGADSKGKRLCFFPEIE